MLKIQCADKRLAEILCEGDVYRRNENGKQLRKNIAVEVNFVCNKGYDRVYVQSALSLSGDEKKEQELLPLLQIKDSFPKVVIAGGMQPTYRDDNGILILNVFDFLLGGGM